MVLVSATAISLFSGAMGLDLGFENTGFDLRIALDVRHEVCKTISMNRPNLPVLNEDISNISTSEILSNAGLKPGEPDILIGGPPCQSFSTAGTRRSFDDNRGRVLFEFVRVIREARPRFFIFENVKGLTTAALRHIPIYERLKKKESEIEYEQRLGTAFAHIQSILTDTRYKIKFGILNAADYGTPQKRQRLIIIGSRDWEAIEFPEPTHGPKESPNVISGQLAPWITLGEALYGLEETDCAKLPQWGKYIKYVKPGGCWRDLPNNLQQEAMKGAYFSIGGRTSYFRRLSWDSPSPTLVTSPVHKGSSLIHPDHDRALSIQEYARLQGFPDNWKFYGSMKQRYRMIGEAVPVQLSTAIAKSLRCAMQKGEPIIQSRKHSKKNVQEARCT